MALFAQRRLHTVCTPRRPSCGSMRRCRNAPATWASVVALLVLGVHWPQPMLAAVLKAGAAKVDISRREAGPVDGPLHARALVIEAEHTRVALVALDVVAIGEIGYLDNEFLPALRRRVEEQLSIPARNLLVNASHCHGVPCADVEERTFQAIKAAAEQLEPVRVGAGSGYEDRVSENRRFKLKDGRVVDSRMPNRCRPMRRLPKSASLTLRSAYCGSTGKTAARWRWCTTLPAIPSRVCRAGSTPLI
ncbi:MAG: hypothetical protein K6T86_01050 [Pirellulales bacterium]|nr:hypothetical protein [Pirellulales bacterium]